MSETPRMDEARWGGPIVDEGSFEILGRAFPTAQTQRIWQTGRTLELELSVVLSREQKLREQLENWVLPFLDAHAEAECQGDPPRMIPNEAMRLATDIRDALERTK